MTPVDIDDIHDYYQAANLELAFNKIVAIKKARKIQKQQMIRDHWRSRLARALLDLAIRVNHPENDLVVSEPKGKG